MEIGLIGLGKMGLNLAKNMRDHQIEVVAFDLFAEARQAATKAQIKTVTDLQSLVKGLTQPRIVWSMLPAGKPTDDTIKELSELLDEDDVVIDGGNSFYQDSIRHAEILKEQGIHFFDVGTRW